MTTENNITEIPAIPAARLFLIIENHILREAMGAIFQRQSEFCVVDCIRFSTTAYDHAAASQCDVLLADQSSYTACPGNFIGDLLSLSPGRKAVLFGMEDDAETFLRAVRSGVSGYLLRDASAEDAVVAVRKVIAGHAVCPPWLCQNLFQFVAHATREGSMILNQRLCAKLGLTARRQELVALLARGLTTKEIAKSLHLSEFTVEIQVHRIVRQLKLQSRHAAFQTVCEQNLAASI
jgi:DNA-binding NarL/FixJ family response regulator